MRSHESGCQVAAAPGKSKSVTQKNPLKYRPDIDGLRAVAVLGVVIFHAFPKALPGGFCGVDIFFVISGYLISGILYKGVREGGFSFQEFYARRVRRLFPSLITVMLLCLGYGYVVLLSDEYRQLGKHVAAGTLFIQNIVFWQESGYWDVASSLKPLLHLWSLAVEEQFYIIFPPLLLLIWKRKWPMVAILWILLGVSLIANLVMSTQDRSSDFYLTTYRAWEFLGGSLLAWWHYGKSNEEEATSGNALSVIGMILIAVSMILLKEKEPYPGYRAIFPVAGSIAFIAAGRQSWINRRILANPLVVWIGLISYPLYLFHWPALSFVHIIKGENPDPRYISGALGIAFLLTIATYYLVEKPARFSKVKWTVLLLTGVFVIMGCIGILIWRGTISSSTDPKLALVQRALADRNWGAGTTTLWTSDRILLNQCGGTGSQTLFFGDSNMQQYVPRIAEILKDSVGTGKRGALFLTCGGAMPIPGITGPSLHYQGGELFQKLEEILRSDRRVDRVVITALWPHYFACDSGFQMVGDSLSSSPGEARTLAALRAFIEALKKQGKEVTVVLAVPYGEKVDPKLSCDRGFLGAKKLTPALWNRDEFLESEGAILSRIARFAKEGGARVVDPVEFLCPDGICLMETTDGPIRYHMSHLRPGFVREHIKYLDQTVAP